MSTKLIPLREARNCGISLAIISAVAGHFSHQKFLLPFTVIFLAAAGAVPGALRPIAALWIPVTDFIGRTLSRIILTTIFCLLVVPVGLFRQITGHDPMQLKKWKKGRESVFIERNHTFTKKDLEELY